MPVRTPYDTMAAEYFARAPAFLRRELLTNKDSAIRHAVEWVGGPNLPDYIAFSLFGTASARESVIIEELKRFAGAHATGAMLPSRAGDFDEWRRKTAAIQASGREWGGWGNAPMQAQGGGAPAPRREPTITRHPYCIFGQTTLAASSGAPTANAVTPGSAANYNNGTGFDFVVTHIMLTEGQQPLKVNPSYRVQIAPQSGPQWSPQSNRTDANALMENFPSAPISNVANFASSCWNFEDSVYVQGANQGMAVAVQNNNTSEAMQCTVMVRGTKQNDVQTPRIFSDTVSLAAGQAQTYLQSGNFQGDGDFNVELYEIIVSSGIGNWCTAAPSAPFVFIRPADAREFMNNPTPATNINNTPGSLGPYWKLKAPIRIPRGTAININFENTLNAAVIANANFVGYLEIARS